MNLCEQAKKEQWPLNECAQCGVLDFSFQLKINGVCVFFLCFYAYKPAVLFPVKVRAFSFQMCQFKVLYIFIFISVLL